MTIADLSIVATVSTLAIFVPVTETDWPKLHAWFQQMKDRPSYQCNLAGLSKLYGILLQQVDFEIYAPSGSNNNCDT